MDIIRTAILYYVEQCHDVYWFSIILDMSRYERLDHALLIWLVA